jgi:hypothetical protein
MRGKGVVPCSFDRRESRGEVGVLNGRECEGAIASDGRV